MAACPGAKVPPGVTLSVFTGRRRARGGHVRRCDGRGGVVRRWERPRRRGSALLGLDARWGLGVANGDLPGIKSCWLFVINRFPAESPWLHVVSGTVGDSRGQQMPVAVEQPAVVGHIFAAAAPSNAVHLKAQLLGISCIPVPAFCLGFFFV